MGKRTWLRRAGVSDGAAVIAVAVAACASPGGPAPGGGGQPTRPGVSPTAFVGAGTLPKASCGSALTHGLNSRTQLLGQTRVRLAASRGSKSKVSATPCRLDTVTNAGVRLSCAGENLLIPAKVGLINAANAGTATGAGFK